MSYSVICYYSLFLYVYNIVLACNSKICNLLTKYLRNSSSNGTKKNRNISPKGLRDRHYHIKVFRQPAGMENSKTGLTIRHRRMSVVRIQRVYFGENMRSFSSGQMKLFVGSTVSTVNPPLRPRGVIYFKHIWRGGLHREGGLNLVNK